ncbi:MAG: ComF family protein [Ruminococcus sp.]|nr:ComF family protein [Ruminococcus sp.]
MKITDRKITLLYKAGCAFLPDRCPFCDIPVKPGELYCKDCSKKLKFIRYKTYAKGGFDCTSVFPYTGEHKAAVTRFKFNNRKQYAYPMARMMADSILKNYPEEEFDLITYVPLHKQRHRTRGYNQCKLLARKLSRILGIPYKSTLIKTKHTAPQHTLKKPADREKNVKGAFRVIDKELLKNKRILLLDDIITTGYTLGECASTLNKCKPASVKCATFAITVVKTT